MSQDSNICLFMVGVLLGVRKVITALANRECLNASLNILTKSVIPRTTTQQARECLAKLNSMLHNLREDQTTTKKTEPINKFQTHQINLEWVHL